MRKGKKRGREKKKRKRGEKKKKGVNGHGARPHHVTSFNLPE
jgi:hypothetical protein